MYKCTVTLYQLVAIKNNNFQFTFLNLEFIYDFVALSCYLEFTHSFQNTLRGCYFDIKHLYSFISTYMLLLLLLLLFG